MKFRKKSVVVDAFQFFAAIRNWHGVHYDDEGKPYVTTIHGERAHLADRDWIIQEERDGKPVFDRFYPCKPDIFAETYEPVEEEE